MGGDGFGHFDAAYKSASSIPHQPFISLTEPLLESLRITSHPKNAPNVMPMQRNMQYSKKLMIPSPPPIPALHPLSVAYLGALRSRPADLR